MNDRARNEAITLSQSYRTWSLSLGCVGSNYLDDMTEAGVDKGLKASSNSGGHLLMYRIASVDMGFGFAKSALHSNKLLRKNFKISYSPSQ